MGRTCRSKSTLAGEAAGSSAAVRAEAVRNVKRPASQSDPMGSRSRVQNDAVMAGLSKSVGQGRQGRIREPIVACMPRVGYRQSPGLLAAFTLWLEAAQLGELFGVHLTYRATAQQDQTAILGRVHFV